MQLQTALIIASFVIELSLASYPPLQFDLIRESQEVNDMEFICRNATIISFDQIEDAKYFVNTTQVEQGLLSPSNHGHSYRITRDREGNYSCGVHGSNSNGRVLLGKAHIDTVHRTVSVRYIHVATSRLCSHTHAASPEVDDTIQTNYSTSVGEEVTLVCPIPRGVMQASYAFRWIRNHNTLTSSETIRIAFDESRFTLTMLNTPASANGTYRCDTTVIPPEGNRAYGEASVHLHVSGKPYVQSYLSAVMMHSSSSHSLHLLPCASF